MATNRVDESHDELLKALCLAVGPDGVRTDEAALELAATDIFFESVKPACVVRPRDKGEVAAVVAAAANLRYGVHPRGGGMSYTRAYLPEDPRSIALDLSALDRVIEINAEDLYVTVQPAVTWKRLYEALRSKRLRVPVFGTMSGSTATVGGGLSQGSIFYGSGLYGTSADMLLGLEVVLPSGQPVRTGSGGTRNGKPFFRYYGPDLGGPFLGDCGAFGVKVEATLRLMAWPDHVGFASFGFSSFEPLIRAQSAISRAGIAAENYAFDSVLQHQLMERTSLLQDARSLARLIGHGHRLLKSLQDVASIASTGKRFLDNVSCSLHVVVESRYPSTMQAALSEVTQIASREGGTALPDTIPRMIRSDPFASMDATLGPAGERWVPTHGFVPLSVAQEAMRMIQALFGTHRSRMLERNVIVGILGTTIAPAAYVIEALFYWPDKPSSLHRTVVSPSKLAQGDQYPENQAARAMVAELRAALVQIFAALGGGHFGVGKSVPYASQREPTALELLRTLKHAIDPDGILNPGALGLDSLPAAAMARSIEVIGEHGQSVER